MTFNKTDPFPIRAGRRVINIADGERSTILMVCGPEAIIAAPDRLMNRRVRLADIHLPDTRANSGWRISP